MAVTVSHHWQDTQNAHTTADIYDLMDDLSQQLPWIGLCINKIDVTNVGRQHEQYQTI